ncbi:hypothetical protein K1W54_02600 [Micromonospora sp. CPCC 205371]|nr:hypothetical protein [Micromonospora sp. CPCC 205371]
MLGPEPAWCVFGHFDDDRLDDRRHVSAAAEIKLSLVDSQDRGSSLAMENRWEPARLRVDLVQRLTEAQPAVRLFRDNQSDKPWVTCTLTEAETLATNLAIAAERGEEALPTEPASDDSPFWQTTACPPWCNSGHEVRDFYDDRTHIDLDRGWATIDLHLERADEKEPEQLQVLVLRDYQAVIGVVSLSKSGAAGVDLTPAEARNLARHLCHLVEASRQAPDQDSCWPGHGGHPDPLRRDLTHRKKQFPCPHRIPWCSGHSKREIKDARTPGDGILHHGDIDSVPFSIGSITGTVDVAVEYLTEGDRQPFAYLQVVGGDGGAELDAISIDHTIAALHRAKALIEANHPDLVPTATSTAVTYVGAPSARASRPLPNAA